MELDFDKYCVVDGSPKTVLSAPRRRSKVVDTKSNGKPNCGNDILSVNGDFTEIGFNRYRSASCKDARSRRSNQDDSDRMKRASVYQSSKEIMRPKRTGDVNGRKKIEFSGGSMSMFSFGIIDSLCCSDEDSSPVEHKRTSVMPPSIQSTSTLSKNQIDLCFWDSINDSFHPFPERIAKQKISSSDKKEKQFRNHQSVQDLKVTSESVVAPVNGCNSTDVRDSAVNLHKSLSAKSALLHSPAESESDGSKTSCSNVQFSPVRKILDPFIKCRSHRSLLSCVNETGSGTVSGRVGIDSSETISKSQLNDSSDKPHQGGYSSQCKKNENHDMAPLCSPAHLHGLLKLKNKHGLPFFEFTVKSPEDVYVAKTWKVDNALTWVYTFHSLNHRRKSNASGWGFKGKNRESCIVGQMVVSCYLCTEQSGAEAFSECMVTEFVLYDIAHSRKSISSQDNCSCSPDVSKAPLVSDEILPWSNCEQQYEISAKTKNNKVQLKHSCNGSQFQPSASQPLTASELHPELEIAAIVMQVPFKKRESLKFNSGDRKTDTLLPKLIDLCELEQADGRISDTASPGKMHVAIPAGNHSLPCTTSRGASPLLDRWRLGGGCDCGGWDMACPLDIFGNPNFHIVKGPPLMHNQHPSELFVQGRKDNIPAFSMRAIAEESYAVDFHAQLSSLQAFSICVAILHAAEASSAVEQERSRQMLQSDSLEVLAEEEIKSLLNSMGEEETFKPNKKTEEVVPSFVINPPFSPISRV